MTGNQCGRVCFSIVSRQKCNGRVCRWQCHFETCSIARGAVASHIGDGDHDGVHALAQCVRCHAVVTRFISHGGECLTTHHDSHGGANFGSTGDLWRVDACDVVGV